MASKGSKGPYRAVEEVWQSSKLEKFEFHHPLLQPLGDRLVHAVGRFQPKFGKPVSVVATKI